MSMSETREASWYEIALTHSQIVKIFVGLLLCIVGAFFSGIWIGRDAVNAVENVPLTVATGSSPVAPGAGEDAEGESEPEVGQLHFFSKDDVVPTADGAAGRAGGRRRHRPRLHRVGPRRRWWTT